MEEIKFIQEDHVGENTLDVIAEADKFNSWMYRTIRPFCKGRVLEIGSGIGNISRCFIEDGYQIMLSDIRERYCTNLEAKFGDSPNLLGIETMDLTDTEFDSKFGKYFGQFDTVFALNVLEHIRNNALALKNCHKLLAEGGQVVILVPSYQKLYNQFDQELGHYTRYTKATLSELFLTTRFRIIHSQYFNFAGIFGWFISGSILKKKSIPGGQMKLYNFLVPVIRIIDKLVFNSAGLSTILVGRKE